MLPSAATRVHSQNGISIGLAIFAQLTAECRQVHSGMFFPLKIAPALGGPPSNTWFLEPTRAHNQNGISIGYADFAQLTAVSSGMPGHVLSRKNCPFVWGSEPNLMHASLDPPESITQTASRSVQLVLQGSRHIVIGHARARRFP